ncbi:GlsB/YeaQ/YmgE family stress response membrane protein [Brachybacterium hainanense]|uniref:GlsB/YeaQ/YmgE family stress response membrane protein n=1 Tax=Brachybacterium hainanense TaxID=1541174 RepID=A0ABV6RBH2_9MICO
MIVLVWIIIGLFVGALAKNMFGRRARGGWVSTIVLGVLGSLIGAAIFRLVTGGTLATSAAHAFSWLSVIPAILGAALLAFGWRAYRASRGDHLPDARTPEQADKRVQGQNRP